MPRYYKYKAKVLTAEHNILGHIEFNEVKIENKIWASSKKDAKKQLNRDLKHYGKILKLKVRKKR